MTDHRQVIIDQANGLLAGDVTDTGMLLDALTALTGELAAKDRVIEYAATMPDDEHMPEWARELRHHARAALATEEPPWRQDLDSGQRPLPEHMYQGR